MLFNYLSHILYHHNSNGNSNNNNETNLNQNIHNLHFLNNNNNNNIDNNRSINDDDDDIIYIGKTPVPKHDIVTAFGGTLMPGVSAPSMRKFANPAPLGLSAFALTTFVLSLVNARARGVSNSSIVVGLAFFYGGVIQLLAGMWEMTLENTFGATALSSYGGFWLSYAAINTDAFGIVSSYSTDLRSLNYSLGFYLSGWFVFTSILCLCTVRATVAFFTLFFLLSVTFLLLALSHFFLNSENEANLNLTKAGGYFGIFTAFVAWYNAYAGIASHENTFWSPKGIPMPWNAARKQDKKN